MQWGLSRRDGWRLGVGIHKDISSEYETGMELGWRGQSCIRGEVAMRAGYLGLQVRRGRFAFKCLMNWCYLPGCCFLQCLELSAPGSALSSGKGSLPLPFQRPPASLSECRAGACTHTVCVAAWEVGESDSGLGKSCAAQWCHPSWHDRVLLGVETGFIFLFIFCLFISK